MRITSLLAAVVVGCFLMSGCVPQRPETRPDLARSAAADAAGELLPTGVRITPEAAAGALFQPLQSDLPGRPSFVAGQAVTTTVSPDGQTLLILTSGYNRTYTPDGKSLPEASNEYVFVYDISGKRPVKRQVLPVPNPTATLIFDLRVVTQYASPAYPIYPKETAYVTSLSDRRGRICHPHV